MNPEDLVNKNILWRIIKRLAALYHEEEGFTLREYGKEVYNDHAEDLKLAIQCFKDLIAQAEQLPRRVRDAAKAEGHEAVPPSI